MKIEKSFWEKVKLEKCPTESDKFLEIGGNLKQGVNASLHQEGWTPVFQRECDSRRNFLG